MYNQAMEHAIALSRSRLALGWPRLGLLLVVTLAAAAALWYHGTTALPLEVQVDGHPMRVATHQPTVGDALRELRLTLAPEDRVQPALTAPLAPGTTITVQRARPVWIVADGRDVALRTHATTVGELAREAALLLDETDEIYLDGVRVAMTTTLPAAVAVPADGPRFWGTPPWNENTVLPLTLTVRRAVPLTVHDGTVPVSFRTTASSVGEALHREHYTLYLGDQVDPPLGTQTRAGLHVFIQRSTPVVFRFDGETLRTRTRQATVGAALAEQGIMVAGLDRVEPAMTTALAPNMSVAVVRIREQVEIEQDVVPFETIWVGDNSLPIDQRAVQTQGQAGITRHRYRVRYEDNQVISRTLDTSWVAQEPITRVLAYGRLIEPKTLQTADGEITYWRKVRMYTTAYTAASAGRPRTHPAYGRTRIGLTLRTGIVAVDPTVVPLRSWVYVPGYGKGIAGDTGGGVKGKFIDLGYSEGEYQSWHWWTDVYLLWPPPPAHQIRWLLPDWPKYPDRRR